MIRSIIQRCFHTDYRISCKRSLAYRFLKTFFDCREIILRNCSPYDCLLKNIWCLQVA